MNGERRRQKKKKSLEKEKGDATGNFGKESSDKPSSSVKSGRSIY